MGLAIGWRLLREGETHSDAALRVRDFRFGGKFVIILEDVQRHDIARRERVDALLGKISSDSVERIRNDVVVWSELGYGQLANLYGIDHEEPPYNVIPDAPFVVPVAIVQSCFYLLYR